jgi:hypothetical protein
MKPSLDLFLAALIVGLGFGLGWAFITWVFNELVALARK